MIKCLNNDLLDLMMDCDNKYQSNPVITKVTIQTIEEGGCG